jgi:TatA/E family protein of Tat protein translocase
MNFFDMGIMEIVVILLVAILIFGPGRIPEVGRNIGRGLRAFRKMTGGLAKEFTQALDAEDKTSAGKSRSSGGLDKSLDKLEKGAKTLDKFLKDSDKNRR